VGKKLTYILAFAGLVALATRADAPIRNIHYQLPLEKSAFADFGKFYQENEERGKVIAKKFDDLAHYRTDNFEDDETYLLIARLMLGEDEEHPDLCKIADVSTALNRAKRNNTDIRTEILRPWAYSCFWLEDSKTFLKDPLKHSPLKYTQEFPKDLELARNFLDGKYKDPTYGATSYYNPNAIDGVMRFVKGLGRIKTPRDWDMNNMIFTVKIGDHYYFKEKN
jgi:hypothetical protein